MSYTNGYTNGVRPHSSYHIERGATLAAGQIAELQLQLQQVQSENTELNRRLSLQNRPGKQLGGVIECASIILSEHTAGGTVGAMAIKGKYPNVGRRRREWGVALLRLAGIVRSVSKHGLTFNGDMSVNRAWQKLTATAEELSQSGDAIEQLRHYLPKYRR